MVELRGEKKRLKVLRTHVEEGTGTPGEMIAAEKHKWIIAAGEEAISLDQVQLEGKKAMSAGELLRGISKDCFSFV
jgi:methionyl-tRNA formyltransferase